MVSGQIRLDKVGRTQGRPRMRMWEVRVLSLVLSYTQKLICD